MFLHCHSILFLVMFGNQSPQSTNEILDKAFNTALLLSGSARRAEAAVLEGIRLMDMDYASDETLLRGSMTAAIESTPQLHEDTSQAASMLPAELGRVLHLAPKLRHCFVLRLLMGRSSESCARLLHLSSNEVDDATCIAAAEFAGIAEKEEARWMSRC